MNSFGVYLKSQDIFVYPKSGLMRGFFPKSGLISVRSDNYYSSDFREF